MRSSSYIVFLVIGCLVSSITATSSSPAETTHASTNLAAGQLLTGRSSSLVETTYTFGANLAAGQPLTGRSSSLVETTYTFGANLALNASLAGSYYASQNDSLVGFQIWRDWWNTLPASSRTTAWGEVVKVELHIETFSDYNYNPASQATILDVYSSMASNSSIDFFFNTIGWNGNPVRQYCYENLSIPMMIGPVDSNQEYYSIPGSFGVPTANVLAMTSWLPYLGIAGAMKVAIVNINDGIYQSEMCQGIVNQAPQKGLEVVANYQNMPFDYYTMGEVTNNDTRISIWQETIDAIAKLNPDVLVICDYTYGAEFSLGYMRQINWIPKFIGISPLYYSLADPTLLNYVVTIAQYDKSAKYTAQTNFTDDAGFNQLVLQNYGRPATVFMAEAALAGMMYTQVLVTSPSNSTQDLLNTMRLLQVNSFIGTTTFDVYDRQTMPTLVIQLLDSGNLSNVVGPPLAAAANLIYPMPSWDERTFNPKWGSGVEIAGVVLMCLGLFVTVFWTAFLLIHWQNKVITAASPLFCLTVLAGALIVYISIFSWMPNLISDSVCNLRVWLLPLGFMMMFGSLLAKTNRVHRLWSAKGVEVMAITNTDVSLVILAIVVFQAVLSILMITIPTLQANITIIDEYRVAENYWTCTFPTSLKILFGVDVGYAFLLLIWGSYLAYNIRRVPIAIYDESKIIGFSIYNVFIFAVVVIVIQLAVGNNDRDVTFMVTAVCCFAGATVTTTCLFAAKWLAIYRPPTDSEMSAARRYANGGTSSSSSSGNYSRPAKSGNRSGGNNSNDPENNTIEQLMASLAESDRKISRLTMRIQRLTTSEPVSRQDVKMDDN